MPIARRSRLRAGKVTRMVGSTSDIDALRLFAVGESVVGHEAALQFVRVLGASTARVAEAAVSLFVTPWCPLCEQPASDALSLVEHCAR